MCTGECEVFTHGKDRKNPPLFSQFSVAKAEIKTWACSFVIPLCMPLLFLVSLFLLLSWLEFFTRLLCQAGSSFRKNSAIFKTSNQASVQDSGVEFCCVVPENLAFKDFGYDNDKDTRFHVEYSTL